MFKYYSHHLINNKDQFSFDPIAYSQFKYGNGFVAKEFGTQLALGFIEKILKNEIIEGPIVVISSPYCHIPTATFALKNAFCATLNHWLIRQNLNPVEETKIHRTVTYKEDYGNLSAEERIALIGNDRFHVDKLFLKDKTLILLDDIKITGSHERVIKKLFNDFNIFNPTYFLYFAELVDENIHPKIENFLNNFSIKSISDVDNIVKSDMFAINTRLVKYLLNYNIKEFELFLESQNCSFIEQFYHMAVGNSYHSIDQYSSNFIFLQSLFVRKRRNNFL